MYDAMRGAVPGTRYPGYMMHEAALWSPGRQRWLFFPRRVSTSPYNEVSAMAPSWSSGDSTHVQHDGNWSADWWFLGFSAAAVRTLRMSA